MSYMSEKYESDYIDDLCESALIEKDVSLYENYLDKVENHIWEDKNGNEYKIEEMETSYLINCLNKINRDEDFRPEYKEIIENELEKRGIKI